MAEGSGGKTVHVAGAGLLAIVAVCGRSADDCGRVGVRGASMIDDGAHVGRGALLADDAARGGSLADDAAREASRAAAGGRPIYGRPTFVDDGAGTLEEARAAGGSPSVEVAKTSLEVSLDVASNAAPDGPRPRFAGWNVVTERPWLLALLPTTRRAYERLYGAGPDRGSLAVMRSSAGSPPRPDAVEALDLPQRLAEREDHNPIGVLLYADGEVDLGKHIALVLPDGAPTDEAEVHRRCVARGVQCVVLVCAPEPAAQRGACGKAARAMWTTAAAVGSAAPVRGFLSALLDAREANPAAREIVISRLEFDATAETFELVRSRARAGKRPR